MFLAKHTEFPLSHRAEVVLFSHPLLGCSELHSTANGFKWAFSLIPLVIALLHHSSSCQGIKTTEFFLLFTLDQIIRHACSQAYDKSSTIPTLPIFSGATTQEKYLNSSHSPHLNYRSQKYFRPQSTRERRDPVKQQKASKVSEVTIFQIFWSPFYRVIEGTWILQLGCLSGPCLILDCCNSANLFHSTSAAGLAPHLAILVFIQFRQTSEGCQYVSFGKISIRLPALARQRAPCLTSSSGANEPPTALLRKASFSYPSVKSHSDQGVSEFLSHWASRLLIIFLNEVITTSNSQCSTTGWPILHPFQRTGRSTAALWNRFLIPLTPSGSNFILDFTFLQVHPYPFPPQCSFNPSLSMLQLSTRTGVFYKPCTQEALSICMHGARQKHISAEEESEVGVRHFIF